MTGKHALQLTAGVAFAGFFIWLILRQVDPGLVWTALRDASPAWLGLGLAAFFSGYACRVERWRIMLRGDNPGLRWRDCAGPLFASVAANNVLPLRTGDLLRSFAFNGRLGISAGVSVATLVVERLLDLATILLFLAVAFLAFGGQVIGGDVIGPAIYLAGAPVAGAAVLIVLLLAPSGFERLAAPALHLAGRFAPGLARRLEQEVHKIVQILTHIGGRSTLAALAGLSLLAWIFEALVFYWVALALPTIAHPVAALQAMPVGTLATAMPSAPGFVGAFDYFIILTMKQFGNAETASAAFAVLVHAMLWLPPTVTGGAYLLFFPLKGARAKSP
jgi:uncharacterized protein (TIRG00374 family)